MTEKVRHLGKGLVIANMFFAACWSRLR